MYGSHFGSDHLKSTYPGLYNSTLPHKNSSTKNDGVRVQHLSSINGTEFLSVSKNRYFGKGKNERSDDVGILVTGNRFT